MITRREEDRPQIDYMQLVKDRLTKHPAVASIDLGAGEKKGAASADLRVNGETVTIDHAQRRLTIKTPQTASVAEEVKKVWRGARGPSLKTR